MLKNLLKAAPVLSVVALFAVVGTLLLTNSNAGPQDPNDPNFPIADTNGDLTVNIFDLSYTLNHWGTSNPTADFTGDNIVNIQDLSYLLAQWGRVDAPNQIAPIITAPEEGSVLNGASQTFTWTDSGHDEYWLYVGSSANGAEYYDSGNLFRDTSTVATGIPQNSSTVHATLWYKNTADSEWQTVNTTYTAAEDPGGGPGTSTDAWDYYGNPWAPHYLGNLNIRDGWRFSFRFEAKSTGVMEGFQNFFIATSRPGYSSGNGGTYALKLVPDNGAGLPDESQTLASTQWAPNPPLVNGDITQSNRHLTTFAQKFWDTPVSVTAGEIYHVVFDNVDANESLNYMSLDMPLTSGGTSSVRGPLAPSIAQWGVNVDWADGNGWLDFTDRGSSRYEVNMVILMQDGSSYGNSYLDPKPHPDSPHTVSDSSQVRQVFTPTQSYSVDQVSAFAPGNGTLRATLTSQGSTIGSWVMSPYTPSSGHYLIDIPQITLSAGVSYELTFSADSGSFSMNSYTGGCNSGLGFSYPSGSWCDGYAQFNSGSGWFNPWFTYSDLNGVAFRVVN